MHCGVVTEGLPRFRIPLVIRPRFILSVCQHLHTLALGQIVPVRILTQPKRIREVDRISARKPVEVEPSGQPDRIFLRNCPDRRKRVRPRQRNPLCFLPLAAGLPRISTVICTQNRRRALSRGSGGDVYW